MAPTWPNDWRQQLAGEDKAYLKTLERFGSPADLAKSYRDLQAKQSSGQLRAPPPGPDAAPEAVATWRKENGIPEAPDAYVEALKLPGGIVPGDADKPILSQFAARAHELNMPPEHYNGMVGLYYEQLDAQKAQADEADHAYKIASQNDLNKEWGPEFAPNLNAVSNLLAGAPEGVRDQLMGGRTADGKIIGNDPNVLRWLASMAREINPMGSLMPANTSDPMKAGTARLAEIKAIMNGPDALQKYWKDPAIQEEYRQLLEAKDKMTARGR